MSKLSYILIILLISFLSTFMITSGSIDSIIIKADIDKVIDQLIHNTTNNLHPYVKERKIISNEKGILSLNIIEEIDFYFFKKNITLTVYREQLKDELENKVFKFLAIAPFKTKVETVYNISIINNHTLLTENVKFTSPLLLNYFTYSKGIQAHSDLRNNLKELVENKN